MSDTQYDREQLPYIHTYSGVKFRHQHPLPEDINITDIAHHLSLLCRFVGAVTRFYSVAEHSVRVSHLCWPAHQLWALLHDASEAYCNDISRPLKYAPGMENYKTYERLAQEAVCERFGLVTDEPVYVKQADNILLVTEQRDLFDRDNTRAFNKTDGVDRVLPLVEKIVPWSPDLAEHRFLTRFYRLYKGS